MDLKKPQWVGLILLALATTGGSVMYLTTRPPSRDFLRLPMELFSLLFERERVERPLPINEPDSGSVRYVIPESLPVPPPGSSETILLAKVPEPKKTSLLDSLKTLLKRTNPFADKNRQDASAFFFPGKPNDPSKDSASAGTQEDLLPDPDQNSLDLIQADAGVRLLDDISLAGRLLPKQRGAFDASDPSVSEKVRELPEALQSIEARAPDGTAREADAGLTRGKKPNTPPANQTPSSESGSPEPVRYRCVKKVLWQDPCSPAGQAAYKAKGDNCQEACKKAKQKLQNDPRWGQCSFENQGKQCNQVG